MYILVSLFGFVSAFRILQNYEEKNYFQTKQLTKIGTAFVFIVSITTFTVQKSAIAMVLCCGLLLLALQYFPLLTVLSAEKRVVKVIPETLRMILLRMNLGKSFRSAFHEIIKQQGSKKTQLQLKKMFKIVTFPQQKHAIFFSSEMNQLVFELRYVDQLESGAIKYLTHLSNHHKMTSDFRRKSGKIKSQIHLQSILLTLIMIAVALFMLMNFGFQSVSNYLVCSMGLGFVGHLLAFRLGNSIKWRI